MIIIKLATTPQELNMIYQLRYRVFCEEIHSLDPFDYPDKRESDRYDPHSFHFIALENGVAIGTSRLIRTIDGKFMMEDEFELPSDFNRNKAVECSRVAVVKERRGLALPLSLLQAAYIYGLSEGYTHWCGTITRYFDKVLTRAGWRFIYLEDFAEYHNAEVIPFILPLNEDHVRFPPNKSEIIMQI